MAVPKVYGTFFSEPTMRVFACLHEKELEFEFVHVDMIAGEHKREPFLSLNPLGLVPAFEDGDLKLFESRAITKYIAFKHEGSGTQLIHPDPKKMAILAVWMEVEAHHFDPPSSQLVWELALKPMMGITTEATVVEENEAKLAKVLDVYEARFAHCKYLAGDCFTLADLNHIPNIDFLMGTSMKKMFESRPLVKAWCADIMARPAWSKVLDMQEKI